MNSNIEELDLAIYEHLNEDLYKAWNNIKKDLEALEQLQAIEEELGIDLIKLLQTNEIYSYSIDEIKKFKIIGINFNEKAIYFWDGCFPMFLELSDYGKTWALTKEELENENKN